MIFKYGIAFCVLAACCSPVAARPEPIRPRQFPNTTLSSPSTSIALLTPETLPSSTTLSTVATFSSTSSQSLSIDLRIVGTSSTTPTTSSTVTSPSLSNSLSTSASTSSSTTTIGSSSGASAASGSSTSVSTTTSDSLSRTSSSGTSSSPSGSSSSGSSSSGSSSSGSSSSGTSSRVTSSSGTSSSGTSSTGTSSSRTSSSRTSSSRTSSTGSSSTGTSSTGTSSSKSSSSSTSSNSTSTSTSTSFDPCQPTLSLGSLVCINYLCGTTTHYAWNTSTTNTYTATLVIFKNSTQLIQPTQTITDAAQTTTDATKLPPNPCDIRPEILTFARPASKTGTVAPAPPSSPSTAAGESTVLYTSKVTSTITSVAAEAPTFGNPPQLKTTVGPSSPPDNTPPDNTPPQPPAPPHPIAGASREPDPPPSEPQAPPQPQAPPAPTDGNPPPQPPPAPSGVNPPPQPPPAPTDGNPPPQPPPAPTAANPLPPAITAAPVIIGPTQVLISGTIFTIGAEPTVLTVGGQVFTVNPSQIIAPQTTIQRPAPGASDPGVPPVTAGAGILPGAGPTTILVNGVPVTLTSSLAVVDGSSFTIGPGASERTVTIAGQAISMGPGGIAAVVTAVPTPAPGSGDVSFTTIAPGTLGAIIGGTTFTFSPEAVPRTTVINGQTISVGPGGIGPGSPPQAFATSVITIGHVTVTQAGPVVVIDGLTFTIGANSNPTTAVFDGETVSIGPGGIGFATTTLTAPSPPPTRIITTNGVTITEIGSSLAVFGGRTFTIGPGGLDLASLTQAAPPTLETSAIISFPATASTLVVIGGTTFTIGPGATPTTDIYQGKTFSIGPGGVGLVLASTTIPITAAPSASDTQVITSQGITYTVVGSTVVIIGTNTFRIGPGATPVTELLDGKTIVIGPSGVVFAGATTSTGIGASPTTGTAATAPSAPAAIRTGNSPSIYIYSHHLLALCVLLGVWVVI